MDMRLLGTVALLTTLCATPAFAAGCSPTGGRVCLNQSCETLGASTMDGDSKNIIVCLKNDSGALIWKSSTSGGQTCSVSFPWGVAQFQDKQVFFIQATGLSGGNRDQRPVYGGNSIWYEFSHCDQVTGGILFQCNNGSIGAIMDTLGCIINPDGGAS